MQQPDEASGKFKVTSDSILILKSKFGEARCKLRNSTAAKSEACGAMQREEDFAVQRRADCVFTASSGFMVPEACAGESPAYSMRMVLAIFYRERGELHQNLPDGTCKSFSKCLPQVENCGRRRRHAGAVKNAR